MAAEQPTFVWDRCFETGLPSVDAQHARLVELVNRLGDCRQQGETLDAAELRAVFQSLADYAQHHFSDEERLMAEAGIDLDHLQQHARHHREFIEQVRALWQSRETMAHPLETLSGFLAAWLTVHILGEDQAMARQIARIRRGDPPAMALAAETTTQDPATTVLLAALQRLYGLLSEQNLNLAAANQALESRVAERTRELAEAQAQMLQSEKMAAIGQLAAGVAHEINNPVGFVNSNLGTLGKYAEQLLAVIAAYEAHAAGGSDAALANVLAGADLAFVRTDLPGLLADSREGLARVTRIVQDLKDFSHVDSGECQPADLNAAMERTLNVVWNELKYKAEIVRDYGQLPPVVCWPAQINQVFMNLLVNAAQAIPTHGRITIRSGCDGAGVWFEVEDTGVGMSEAVRQRIFEPFFTTKPVGQGTGLGLSIAYDIIVKRHGGQLTVRSRPGEGSCFRVGLPLQFRP